MQLPFEQVLNSRDGPVQLPVPTHSLSLFCCPVSHDFKHGLQSPQVVQSFRKSLLNQ